MQSRGDGRGVNTHRLGCFAAIAAGRIPTLLWRLREHFRTDQRGKRLEPRALLPFAARYSNATCVRAVLLEFDPAERQHLLAPQHLAQAAGRSDLWAEDVLKLLLQLLSPKQLKPSHMRAAYSAACAAGCLPVLQLLVSHAACAPTQHLPVLLEALAGSGNRMVAELLLGDTPAAAQQLHQQQQEQGLSQLQQEEEEQQQQQQQQQLFADVRALRATWQQLHGALQLKVLGNVLPQPPPYPVPLVYPSPLLGDLQDEAIRLHVADLLWQLLPDHARSALQPAHACVVTSKSGTTGPGSGAALPDSWLGNAFWNVELLRSSRCPARLLWLLERELVPLGGLHTGVSNTALRHAQNTALQAGHTAALRLASHLQLLIAEQLPPPLPGLPAEPSPDDVMVSVMALIDGRLAEACSGCDSEALQQLEQLFMLCSLLLAPPATQDGAVLMPTTADCCAPTLPVSLTAGRVVTVAHLSAGLGLPWGLLGTLLAAAEYDQLGTSRIRQLAAPDTCSTMGMQACSTLQQVAAAMLAVEDPEVALQAGVLMPDFLGRLFGLLEASQQGQNLCALHFMLASRLSLLQPCAHIAMPETPEQVMEFHRLPWNLELVVQLVSAYNHGLQELTLQQEQQGPPPLWQQALLHVVAQHAPAVRRQAQPADAAGADSVFRPWADVPMPLLASAYDGPRLLLAGLRAGRSAQTVQQFISTRLFSTSRPAQGPPPPYTEAFGEHILREALVHRVPELLSWSLQPAQQQLLWGSGPDAVSITVSKLAVSDHCSPITCRLPALNGMLSSAGSIWRWGKCLRQQQDLPKQDLAEIWQQRCQLLGPAGAAVNLSCGPMQAAAGPLPQFVSSAVQMALTLLQHPSMAPDTLDKWLRYTVGVRSSLPDLVRARAIVAAVVAAEVLPPGARALHKEAVRQVLDMGDPDLWSVVLLWSHRLPSEAPRDDPAAVAELLAALGAVNI